MKKLLLTSAMMAGIVSFAMAQEAPKKTGRTGHKELLVKSEANVAKQAEAKKARDAAGKPASAQKPRTVTVNAKKN